MRRRLCLTWILVAGFIVTGWSNAVAVPDAPLDCLPPGSPSSFWGYITLNGAPAPLGLKLTAWVNGVEVALSATQLHEGAAYFLIDVPDRASDPDTGEVCRQGGAAGETVAFALCDVIAAGPHGTWMASTLMHLDLNLTGSCGAAAPNPGPPAVHIQRSPSGIQLTWLHIAQDTLGHPLDVARYDIWRSSDPYFTSAGDPYGSALPPGSAQGGDPISFTDNNTALGGAGTYYSVQAISAIGLPSAGSNRVGIFTFPLARGS